MRRRPRPHPRAGPVGVWHQRPSVAPTPPRASAVSHAGRLDRQQLRHTREPGGQAGTATLRRVRAAEKPPRAPGRLVYQPAPEERVESVNAAHLAVNACANAPIGGVGSCARVPPVRRRGEAAPLGRPWLGWGSCLEDRASGASAVPPDPKVDDRASAFLPAIGAAIRGAQVGSAPAHPWHARSRLGVRVSNYCERGVRVCVCVRERGREWGGASTTAATTTAP